MTDRRWYASIPCYGLTALFFPAEGETPTAKQQRVNKARELCMTCPHRTACNELAGPADSQGRHEVQGVWAGVERDDVFTASRKRMNAKRRAS